jgi:ribosomal protein S27E
MEGASTTSGGVPKTPPSTSWYKNTSIPSWPKSSLRPGRACQKFVKEEFDAFLECGILARGFLRLRCADCAHEKLVAFSCKRRGFCPSCGARRMAETAAHLVEHVIPRVPVRQWALSFPIPLRLLFATHPELLAPVLQIVHRVIATFLIQQAGLQRTEAHTGAVTLIQRFGSAADKIARSDFEQP